MERQQIERKLRSRQKSRLLETRKWIEKSHKPPPENYHKIEPISKPKWVNHKANCNKHSLQQVHSIPSRCNWKPEKKTIRKRKQSESAQLQTNKAIKTTNNEQQQVAS